MTSDYNSFGVHSAVISIRPSSLHGKVLEFRDVHVFLTPTTGGGLVVILKSSDKDALDAAVTKIKGVW